MQGGLENAGTPSRTASHGTCRPVARSGIGRERRHPFDRKSGAGCCGGAWNPQQRVGRRPGRRGYVAQTRTHRQPSPPIPYAARHGQEVARSGRESRLTDQTGKLSLAWPLNACARDAFLLRLTDAFSLRRCGVDPIKPDTQRVGKGCTPGVSDSPDGSGDARCCSPPSNCR
jgi:hypothetical protein